MTRQTYPDFTPEVIFPYFWIGQILVLIVGGYEYLIFKYTGMIFILLCLFFYILGPYAIRMGRSNSSYLKRNGIIVYNEKRLLFSVLVLIILGFLKPLNTLLSHGFSLASLLDFSTLLRVNNTLATSRYSGTLDDGSSFTQLLAVFSYSAPLLGGFTYPVCCNSKNKYVCFCSFLPLLFGGLTQGVKMGIIASVFLFISGYVTSCYLLDKKITIKFRSVLYGIICVLVLFSVLLLTMMFRIGKFDVETFRVVCGKFIAYAFGHLPAFDIWFDKQNIIPDSFTFGGKFFMGITNYLGILKREGGLYQDFQIISIEGAATNVYTLFRILIDDFGIILCPVFFFFGGLFIYHVIHRLKCLINYRINSTICVSFLFMTFWSFVTSVFVYTTYLIIFVLFYVIISLGTSKITVYGEDDNV